MALFYMNVRNVQKAKGSAVAKAAYVSGDKLYSEREEEMKSYKTREVNPDSFILAPKHAPEWVYNREMLWNEAERIEKAVNARVMREVVVALPIELSNEQQHKLISEYVQENFVDAGMVADVNIHRDRDQNPHAHILLTIRHFESDGTWAKSRTKKEYLKDKDGEFIFNENGDKKTRNVDLTGWNGKNVIVKWRENLAEKINHFYKENNINEVVSHLSNEERGLDKVSHQRLSRNEYMVELAAKEKAEKNGEDYSPVTYYAQLNQTIDALNNERTLIDSDIQKLQKELNILENELETVKSEPIVDVDKFKEIRETIKVSKEIYDSYQFIRKRTKCSYVKLPEIIKAKDSIDYWKKALNMKDRQLQSEKELLEDALTMYKGGDFTRLQQIGFDPNTFMNVYPKKAQAFMDKHDKLAKEVEKYQEAKRFTDLALNFEKELVIEEFEFLNPNLHRVLEMAKTSDNINAFELMFDLNSEKIGSQKDISNFELNYLTRQILDAETIEKSISRISIQDHLKDFKFNVDTESKLRMSGHHIERKFKAICNDESIDHEQKLNLYTRLKNHNNESEYIATERMTTRSVLEDDLCNIFMNDKLFASDFSRSEVKEYFKEYTDDKLIYVSNRVTLFATNNQFDLNEIESDYVKSVEVENDIKLSDLTKIKSDDEFEISGNDSMDTAGDVIDAIIDQARKTETNNDDFKKKRTRKKLTIEEKIDMDLF